MKPLRSFVTRTPQIQSKAAEFILSLPPSQMFDVIVCEHDPKRNLEQNDLAWLIDTAIAEQVKPEGQGFHKDVWWLQLKREHFGPKIIELPDGSFIEQEPESHNRGRKKFSEFIEYLFWRSADLGVVLPQEAHEMHRANQQEKK